MQNYKIPRSEILKLYKSCLNQVSTHSLTQWLNTVTNDELIIVPRLFILNIIEGLEQTPSPNLYEALDKRWNFKKKKTYL
jgi:hypothetical protein